MHGSMNIKNTVEYKILVVKSYVWSIFLWNDVHRRHVLNYVPEIKLMFVCVYVYMYI
jgi:hypothetical protein